MPDLPYSHRDKKDELLAPGEIITMAGFHEIRAYQEMWLGRVSERGLAELGEEGFSLRQLTGDKKDAFSQLRKMTFWGAFLSYVARLWTRWGLDLREGYLWGSPLAGTHVPTGWSKRARALDEERGAWISLNLPPLQCDRPEYVEAMRNTWAYLTKMPP